MTLKEFYGSRIAAHCVRHQAPHQLTIIAGKTSKHSQGGAEILKRRTVRMRLKRERREHFLIHLVENLGQELFTCLEVIMKHAKVYPRTVGELTEITDLGPWRRQTYGAEILKVLSAH